MAQPSASPTPNVLKPSLAPPVLSNPLFYPRKEFLRDQQRVSSTFSLLTFAGQGLVRLYSFPDSVINGLRRLFQQQSAITSCRESASNHFFEFTLEYKPWANVKTLASEKLIVSILTVVYQYGYSFLSTIEYAREQDDKIALAFSRPATGPVNSSIPAVPNGSASTLPQPGPMLFAISFPSTALLRVIDPPLALTPGILQAVRNAWPRGISSEKKVGDSYEFKLKGYKWFQENTFAVDSLQQILSLLSALDRHSFTLLTSLTMGSRSRTRDLWIFIGPPGETRSLESPPASPTTSSLELKREITPQHPGLGPEVHGRSLSPHMSSPLKQVTPSHSNSSSKLKKPFPKAQIPFAFASDSSLNDAGHPPSEIGSVDMTGVGTHRRAGSQNPTPDVFYTTGPVQPGNVYQQEFNPWNRAAGAPPIAATNSASRGLGVGGHHSRHYSISSTQDPILRAANQDSPYDAARGSMSSSSTNSRSRRASSPLASSPLNMQPPILHVTSSSDAPTGQDGYGFPQTFKADSDPHRTPTPPLLGGAFRDSAFSSSTRTTEIPIAWTGKYPEPTSNGDVLPPISQSPPRATPFGPRERKPSGGVRPESQQAPQPPLERRGSSGPILPGGWAPTPQEEKRHDDVVGASGTTLPVTTSSSASPPNSSMIPPTIAEQPSQEGDELLIERKGSVRVLSPEQHRAQGDGARKSEAAWVGNTQDRHGDPTTPATHTHANGTANGSAHPTPRVATANGNANGPPKRRANSISEGWVIVNIDGKGKGGHAQGQLRPPQLKHQRSQSDSHVPTLAQTAAAGAGKATMSPAAKAIVMVDAVGVKEAQREKAQSGSKLRRLLGRDKGDKGSSSSPSTTPEPSERNVRSHAAQGSGVKQAVGGRK